MKSRKVLGVLLAAAMLTGALSGCQGNNGSGASSSEASSSSTSSIASIGPATLTVNGEKVDVPYVMKVGGREVSLEEYRYYYLNTKSDMDGGDQSYWDDEANETALKEATLETIKRDYTVYRVAEDNNIALTDEDQESVSSKITSAKNNYETEDDYLNALNQAYLNEEMYQRFVENNVLYNALYNKLTLTDGKYAITEEAMRELLGSDYARVKHILISFDSDGTETNKEKATAALSRAKDGEDFDALVEEYNEDTGMAEDGYCFTHGEMVEAFEKAAFALVDNEISDIVESDYGYHIIKRLPIDDEYIENNLSTLTNSYRKAQLNNEMTAAFQEISVEFGDQYDSISTKTLA